MMASRRRLIACLALIATGWVAASAATLKPFVRGSWAQLRKAHQDKPLLVHFWGVTCVPCLGELPKWGDLQRERPTVDVVLVAADPVPVTDRQVQGALAKAKLDTADNWMFADEFAERLRYQVNPDWAGELPYSILIAPDGTTRAIYGIVDFGQINRWIDVQASIGSGKGHSK